MLKKRPQTMASFIYQLKTNRAIDTQKSNPIINTNFLLSVLITDAQITTDNSIAKRK